MIAIIPNSFGAMDEGPIYLEASRAPVGHLPPVLGVSGPPTTVGNKKSGYGAPFIQPLYGPKRVLARTYQIAGLDKKGKPKQPKPYRWQLPRTTPVPPQAMYGNG